MQRWEEAQQKRLVDRLSQIDGNGSDSHGNDFRDLFFLVRGLIFRSTGSRIEDWSPSRSRASDRTGRARMRFALSACRTRLRPDCWEKTPGTLLSKISFRWAYLGQHRASQLAHGSGIEAIEPLWTRGFTAYPRVWIAHGDLPRSWTASVEVRNLILLGRTRPN